jgi:sigma-B regulation protein RsbU (phosphoserine phosphatase)
LWKPAREVSGDLYDFVRLDENRLAVVVADVSDKGMPAALFMSLVRSALRASAVPDLTPAQSVMQANRVIAADAHGGMFVTVFFAVIDFANQRMTYVNGGHPPPLVFRATSNDFVELTRTGIALGIFGSALYTEQVVEIQPEDWVVMYTDGVTDAASPRGEAFGEERLRRILEAHTHSGASTIVDSMDLALHEFIDDAAPFDDITILAAKHGN